LGKSEGRKKKKWGIDPELLSLAFHLKKGKERKYWDTEKIVEAFQLGNPEDRGKEGPELGAQYHDR